MDAQLITPTKNYKPMWATINPPSSEEIKGFEQEVKELNAKKDGWTYYLNMGSGGNFICFGMRNKVNDAPQTPEKIGLSVVVGIGIGAAIALCVLAIVAIGFFCYLVFAQP